MTKLSNYRSLWYLEVFQITNKLYAMQRNSEPVFNSPFPEMSTIAWKYTILFIYWLVRPKMTINSWSSSRNEHTTSRVILNPIVRVVMFVWLMGMLWNIGYCFYCEVNLMLPSGFMLFCFICQLKNFTM